MIYPVKGKAFEDYALYKSIFLYKYFIPEFFLMIYGFDNYSRS